MRDALTPQIAAILGDPVDQLLALGMTRRAACELLGFQYLLRLAALEPDAQARDAIEELRDEADAILERWGRPYLVSDAVPEGALR